MTRKSGTKGSGGTAGKAVRGSGDRSGVRIRWERRNITLLGAGLAAVVLGYVLLSQGDVTAAPLLLVAGYCVLIPLAFIL
ncbi:hypothetical protein K8I85_14090 [bacterium]|nr:hypothetical protein [bacterium]